MHESPCIIPFTCEFRDSAKNFEHCRLSFFIFERWILIVQLEIKKIYIQTVFLEMIHHPRRLTFINTELESV